MGMFDSVYINCPQCGQQIEYQSKAGGCNLDKYDINNVPPRIGGDIIGDEQQCRCGATIRIEGTIMIWPVVQNT